MKHWLLILALSATVMLTGLGSSRLWDDDEPRNAGCAREMLARWDWIVPWFNNELRAHKPVLTYWCIMASYLVLGESEFSARLPSALAAIGTTLLTYAIGRRLFSPQAALWAALILPTTMLFAMAGRIATPDSLLIFCVTLSMAVYVWTAWPRREGSGEKNHETHEEHERGKGETTQYFPRQWWQAVAIYAAMGLAVLAKGPVGLVLPTAIIGMFLLIARLQPDIVTRSVSEGESPCGPRLRFGLLWASQTVAHFFRTAWSMRPLTALAVVAAVAGPWYLAVGYQTDWQFLEEFFVKHNVERAAGAMEGHRGGIWFYPAMLLVGFFPWSIFAIPLALDLFAEMKQPSRERTAQIFLLCWIGVWLGAFTIARTKLPSYATPCFPAVALLTGHFIERLLAGNVAIGRYWLAVAFGCLAVAGVGAAVAIPLVAQRYLPGEQWLGILGLAPLAGGVIGLILWSQSRLRAAMAGLVLSAAALVLGVFGLGAHVASRHQQADNLLAAAAAASDAPEMGSYKILEPSWVYYGRRPIREIHGPRAEAAEFLAASPDRFLITTEKRWKAMSRDPGGEELTVLAKADHFLKEERLVLIGRPAARLVQRPSSRRPPRP
ncbi:MAG TPA: glycosyltransferase family 39 protein [Pirellulaceae bacterium]|nr:glycosyltransferase family 39 protein [Pirellulaceae bacterium]